MENTFLSKSEIVNPLNILILAARRMTCQIVIFSYDILQVLSETSFQDDLTLALFLPIKVKQIYLINTSYMLEELFLSCFAAFHVD